MPHVGGLRVETESLLLSEFVKWAPGQAGSGCEDRPEITERCRQTGYVDGVKR